MKKISLFLLTVLLVFNSMQLSAQNTLTVADGSEDNSYLPFYGLWMDAMTHCQLIYPASMLANLNGATITSMTFYLDLSPSNVWGCPFNIQLGETTQENYGFSASYIESGLSTVYTGQVSCANEQITITFSTPYTYQGGNLVLDVQNTTTGTFSNARFLGVSTTNDQGVYAYGSYSPTGQTFIPKTSFSYLAEINPCHAPSSISVSNVNATGAMVSWTASEDASNYVIQYKTASQTWENAQSDNVSGTQYDLTGLLAPVTHYDIRVATDCGTNTSFWRSTSFTTMLVPESLPYIATFGENDSWILNNGTNSNYWTKGTTGGVNALFVTNDGNTPGYNTGNSSSVSAEKHIIVGEAGTIVVSFDLQCGGEGTYIPYDYMKLFLAPMEADYATNPSWISYSDGTYAADFSAYTDNSYNYIINLIDGTLHVDALMTNPVQNPDATSLAKLVFGWRNDNTQGDGEGPIITNLRVSSPSCDRPSQPTVSNITAFTAVVAWEAPSADVNDFFVQYVPANMDWNAPEAHFENVSGTSFQLTSLESNTTYLLRVASNCSGDTSLWRTVTFTTPATCYPPVNVAISQIVGTSALVSWEEAFYGADSYTVKYSAAGEENWNTQIVDGTCLMLSGLLPTTAYEVMVYSNCDLGTADTIERNFTTHCMAGGDPFTEGTISTYYIPVNNYYNYTYSQQIFLASEMGGASTIDSIAFEYEYTDASTGKSNVVIYLGHTSQSSFSASSNYIPLSELTQVYSGSLNCQQGWNTFVFSTPFQYNGTDNLVLAVDDNSGDYNGYAYTFLAHDAGAKRTIYIHNDYNNPDPAAPGTYGETTSDRSNVKFFIPCDNTVTCIAPNAYTNEVSTSSITINWVSGSTETSWEMEYQNENDTNWTHVGSVTSPYELTGLDANTAYNIRIRSNCGGGDYSNWTLTSCRTECSVITSLPYTENFDSYGTGGDAFPFCWDRFDSNSDLMPYIYDGGYQSTGSMYFYANNGIYNMAITPEFDASIPLNTLRASFMYKATYSSDRLLVGVISDPEDASTFVAIDTVYPDPTSVSAWVEKEVDFSGYDGTGARYIAFKNQYVSNFAYAYIDNLSINTITNCQKPSALTVSNIDLTSATLSWTEGDDETEWDIEYGPVGFTHGNGTIVHASGIPYDLIGLTANTPYDVYVRADCGGGEVSDWALTPTTFTTLSCNAEEQCEYTVILGDSYGDGWNEAYMTVIQEGTTVATLQAINHELTSTQTYDTLHLYLCSDMPTQVVWHSGVYDGEASILFFSHDGAVLFSLEDLSSISTNILDTFTTNCSGCFVPGNLSAIPSGDATSATISWTIGDEESSWILEYQAAGDSIWTTETISGTPGFVINGLTPSTLYNVRVKSDCGDGESSFITITFRTPCLTTIVTGDNPFSEDFNTLTAGIPECWDNSEGTTSYYDYKWNYYSAGEFGAGLRFDSYYNPNGYTNKLKTPVLDLTALSTPIVGFSYKNPNGGDFSVLLSTDGGYTDTIVIATGLTSTSTWTDVEYNLPNLTDASNVVIVFQGTSNYGNGDAYIYLDNVFVGNASSCPKPTQLAASAATTTSVTLSWTPGGDETSWNIAYGTPGFDPYNATNIIPVSTNPFTLTGLNALTPYEVYVQANCDGGETSLWASIPASFATAGCDITEQCEYVFVCTDSYGDGWNDAYITIQQNGVNVAIVEAVNHNMTSTTTMDTIRVMLCDNISTSLIWNTGQYDYEAGVTVIGPDGSTLCSLSDMGTITSYTLSTFTSDCGGSGPAVIDPTVTTNGATSIGQTSATLNASITNPSDVTINTCGFEWKTTVGGTYTPIAGTGTGNEFTANLTGLTANTSYTYKAFITFNDTTVYGSEMTFTTYEEPVDSCAAPTNLQVNSITQNSSTMTWTAGGSETSWKVGYKLSTASQWQEATVQTTSYNIEGLTANSTYDVRVKAICAADNESDFITSSFTTTGVGIDNITLASSISLMPNPADNYIDLNVNSNVEVKEAVVYNAFGQMIQKVELNDNHARIDLSNMAAGMYFVRVNGDNVSATKKFIKR
ncbi:MAG: fibronectin type III domain-containing protein [Bacteroidales bacterium]|nr:fibronectin type III domain-containing protein [Bacteroidales bacterium]